jgi:hypothetical protein
MVIVSGLLRREGAEEASRSKIRPGTPWGAREEDRMMKLAKRIMITLGSLAALALAGGAHYKL